MHECMKLMLVLLVVYFGASSTVYQLYELLLVACVCLFRVLTYLASTSTTNAVFPSVSMFARQEGTPTTVEFMFDAATSTLTLRKPNMLVREDWSLVLESGPTEM